MFPKITPDHTDEWTGTMSDKPGPEYYQRIRQLRQATAKRRGQHLTVHRLRAALVSVASQLLAETGHATFLADSRAVANELLARHLCGQQGTLPDALTLFVAIGEALQEALSRQARALADQASSAEASASGTTDRTREAITVSTLFDVRNHPHVFLAQAERLRQLRVEKPQETTICLLRRFAGRTPAEAVRLLGQEERVIEDCLTLFEQFDLAPQAR